MIRSCSHSKRSSIDATAKFGLFVLAGSSRFLTVPQLTESLAGRVRIVELWPLSQAELARHNQPPAIVDALLDGTHAVRSRRVEPTGRREVFGRIVRGGFPTPQRIIEPSEREAWFDDYVDTLIRRDLTELSRIRQASDLPRLVRLLAARSAQELNVSSVARDVQLGHDAIRAYLALLETIYLVFVLPAWTTSETPRARLRGKLHFVDSGLAANLLGVTPDQLVDPVHPYTGALVETFVVSELARLAPFSSSRPTLGHYRDKEKREIDLIVEGRDRRLAGVEVKAALDVDETDFRHLAYLRDKLGDRFVNGVVIHLGNEVLSFGDRLTAVPLSWLWSLDPALP